MKFTVLYKRHSMFGLEHGFQAPKDVPRADYDEITTVDVKALGEVFQVMNVVEGDPEKELPMKLQCRSMSVGDIAIDESGKAFYCAMMGWEPVELR